MFFDKYDEQLARMRFGIQQIVFPAIDLKSVNESGIAAGSATENVSTIYGGYNILNNAYLQPAARELTIQILDFQSPIVENFIYPWMEEVARTKRDDKDKSLFPKLNMAVKYWAPNNTFRDMEGVAPDFVYYVTGLFPISMPTITPQMIKGSNYRNVKFSFNDLIVLNSKSDAAKYNLWELFVTSTYNNMFNVVMQKANEGIDKLIDKGEKKLHKILDKALNPLDEFLDPHAKDKDKGGKGGSSSGSRGGSSSGSRSAQSSSSFRSPKAIAEASSSQPSDGQGGEAQSQNSRNAYSSYYRGRSSSSSSPEIPVSGNNSKVSQDIDAAAASSRSSSTNASRSGFSSMLNDSPIVSASQSGSSSPRTQETQVQVIDVPQSGAKELPAETSNGEAQGSSQPPQQNWKRAYETLPEMRSFGPERQSSGQMSSASSLAQGMSMDSLRSRRDTSKYDTVKSVLDSLASSRNAQKKLTQALADDYSSSKKTSSGSTSSSMVLPSSQSQEDSSALRSQARASLAQGGNGQLEGSSSRSGASSQASGSPSSISEALSLAKSSKLPSSQSIEEKAEASLASRVSHEPYLERWKGRHFEIDENHHLKQYVVPEKTREETLAQAQITQEDIDALF